MWVFANQALSPWSGRFKHPKFSWATLLPSVWKVKGALSVCKALVSLECTFRSSVLNHCTFFSFGQRLLIAFSNILCCFAQLRQGLRLSWLLFSGTTIQSLLTGTEAQHTFTPQNTAASVTLQVPSMSKFTTSLPSESSLMESEMGKTRRGRRDP